MSRVSTDSFRDLAVFAALAAGTVIFWHFRIVQMAYEIRPPSNDIFMQIYPMSHRAFTWLREGQIPLWNPFQYCGVPLLATVLYGIFYPLNVFYLLVPRTEVAIECTVILHLFAAGSFTYLYCRAIHLGRWAALAGAVVFMWSGFLVFEALWFTPALAAAVWLPLGFLAIEKVFEDRRFRWSVLLAVAVAMPLLAGWLQTWLYSMYALAAYSAVRLTAAMLAQDGRQHCVRLSLLLAGGVAIGMCLTAVQLLPTLELQSLGPRRPGGLSVTQMLAYGPIAPGKLLADTVDSGAKHPRFSYLGILPLLLAPLAFCTRGSRVRVVFLWCVLLLSAGIALSVHTSLFSIYRALPAATWFRIPHRILFLYAFAGAVLSGIGLDAVTGTASDRPGPRRWWLLGLVVLPAAFWLLTVNMPGRSRLYVVAGVIGIAAVLLLGPRLRAACVLGILALLAYDLFHANRNSALRPYHDISVLDAEREAFDFIRSRQGFDRTYIRNETFLFNYAIMAKQGTLRGIYSIGDYEPLSLERYARFFALIDTPGAADYRVQTFAGWLYLDPSPERLRLLDLMSVRFIITPAQALPFRAGLHAAGWPAVFERRGGNTVVYENPNPLPRAYVATDIRSAPGGDAALGALQAPGFDSRRTVILEANQSQPPPVTATSERGIMPARIADYTPTRVVVETDTPAAGYLVLTDTFYPGWEATLDGAPADTYRANYLFRAVAVPPGRHTVTFDYAPRVFRLGAAITLLTLGGLAVAAVVRLVLMVLGA